MYLKDTEYLMNSLNVLIRLKKDSVKMWISQLQESRKRSSQRQAIEGPGLVKRCHVAGALFWRYINI